MTRVKCFWEGPHQFYTIHNKFKVYLDILISTCVDYYICVSDIYTDISRHKNLEQLTYQ